MARAAASASVGALAAHASGGDPSTGAVTAAFGRLYGDRGRGGNEPRTGALTPEDEKPHNEGFNPVLSEMGVESIETNEYGMRHIKDFHSDGYTSKSPFEYHFANEGVSPESFHQSIVERAIDMRYFRSAEYQSNGSIRIHAKLPVTTGTTYFQRTNSIGTTRGVAVVIEPYKAAGVWQVYTAFPIPMKR